jgi:hypothetical protein
LDLDYPLNGAIDIGISHSLYNQASKKVFFYENQYAQTSFMFWSKSNHLGKE